jgi:hypothetical protein
VKEMNPLERTFVGGLAGLTALIASLLSLFFFYLSSYVHGRD